MPLSPFLLAVMPGAQVATLDLEERGLGHMLGWKGRLGEAWFSHSFMKLLY